MKLWIDHAQAIFAGRRKWLRICHKTTRLFTWYGSRWSLDKIGRSCEKVWKISIQNRTKWNFHRQFLEHPRRKCTTRRRNYVHVVCMTFNLWLTYDSRSEGASYTRIFLKRKVGFLLVYPIIIIEFVCFYTHSIFGYVERDAFPDWASNLKVKTSSLHSLP